MKAIISDRVIKSAVADPTCKVVYDEKLPLELYIQSKRDKATWWLVQYSKGAKKRTRLGYWPVLNTASIQRMLPDALRQLQRGEQPEVNQLDTLGQVLQWYRARVNANTMKKQATRNLVNTTVDAQLLPKLKDVAVASISKDLIDTLLVMPLVNDGLKASTIKKYWSVLKAAVADADRLGKISRHYMAGFKFSDHLQKAIKPKECAIRPGQLPTVLHQIGKAHPVAAMLALFMLMHGTRIAETRLMKWEYVDFISRMVVLPAETTKTGVTHVIPLTDFALELMKTYRHQFASSSTYVFALRGVALSENKAGELISHLSAGKWSSHDLRKTARTTWAKLKVDYFVAERMLNHKPKNLDAIYINDDVIELRLQALTQYHETLKNNGLHTGILQATTSANDLEQTNAA